MAKGRRKSAKDEPSKLLSASSVLQGLLAGGKSPLSDQFLRWKLWRFWPEVVGPTVAKHCEPVGLEKGGRLTLWVKSSARLQELRFLSATIQNKVNEYLAGSAGTGFSAEERKIKSIRFTVDAHKKPRPQDLPTDFNL